MIVEVYRNLRHGRKARPLYSVRHRGRVITHRRRLILSDVTFVVQEAGRQRVLREGCKNVHAFARGILTDSKGAFGIDANSKRDFPIRVTYNPRVTGSFMAKGHTTGVYFPVRHARAVLLNERGMTACYLD